MTTRIDRTIQDTYTTRYENLNGLDYQDYLKSDHWQMVKKKAKRRKAYQKCQFCDSKNIDLHHTSYKWILTKDELRSIIPLCRTHHQEVHDLSNKNKCSVRIATNELRRKYAPYLLNIR